MASDKHDKQSKQDEKTLAAMYPSARKGKGPGAGHDKHVGAAHPSKVYPSAKKSSAPKTAPAVTTSNHPAKVIQATKTSHQPQGRTVQGSKNPKVDYPATNKQQRTRAFNPSAVYPGMKGAK